MTCHPENTTPPGVDLTRRKVLVATSGLMAAAGAGCVDGQALSSGLDDGAARATPAEADVAIIGAGLSGLAAARVLEQQGLRVQVIEARSRVGGRVRRADLDGAIADIGATWVGPTQDRMLELTTAYGIERFESYTAGNTVFYRKGRRRTFDANLLPVPLSGIEAGISLVRFDRMAAEVPPEAPWRAARAEEWDGQTLESWKRRNALTPDARFLIDFACRAVFVCEPKEISLLHVLFMSASAGNEREPGSFTRLVSTRGGAQEQRLAGGAHQLPERLAAELRQPVWLDAPVQRIAQDTEGVTVETARGSLRARRCILAIPPAPQAAIDYQPSLPGTRMQLLQRWPQGTEIKIALHYAEPFWRAQGLSGSVFSDEGPVVFTADGSPAEGRPGVLLAWIKSRDARFWARQPAEDRRLAVLESLVRYFGEAARHPLGYQELDWSAEPYTRGCFGAFGAPGMLTEYGEILREPVGRLHWAGTETATRWYGYMEGAVQAGERAAQEVIDAL